MSVGLHQHLALGALHRFVELPLESRDAFLVHGDEAEHMRQQLAVGIGTLRLLLQIANDFQFISPLCAEKVLSIYRAQLLGLHVRS